MNDLTLAVQRTPLSRVIAVVAGLTVSALGLAPTGVFMSWFKLEFRDLGPEAAVFWICLILVAIYSVSTAHKIRANIAVVLIWFAAIWNILAWVVMMQKVH